MSWRGPVDALGPLLPIGAPERRPPSRAALSRALDHLRGALFHDLLGGAVSPAALLVEAFEGLEAELGAEPGASPDQVQAALATLAGALPSLGATLRADLQAALDGDPAASSPLEVLLCYPGFHAIFVHRVAHLLHRAGAPLVARAMAAEVHARTAIDLHPGATIGEAFFVDHGTGVVVGATAVLGRRVRLYQGVTLGARNFPTDADGRLVRGAPRHPILEDGVVVYAGATILGRITLGAGSVIGGGVWLTRSVPPGSRVLQAALRTSDDFEGGAGI